VDITISNNDFQNTILSFLSCWVSNFASGQLLAVYLYSSLNYTINPDILIILITDKRKYSYTENWRSFLKTKTDNAINIEEENCYKCDKGNYW